MFVPRPVSFPLFGDSVFDSGLPLDDSRFLFYFQRDRVSGVGLLTHFV